MHLVAKLDYAQIILDKMKDRKGRIRQSALKKAVMKEEELSERTFYKYLNQISCEKSHCTDNPRHPLRKERIDRWSYYALRSKEKLLIDIFGAKEGS